MAHARNPSRGRRHYRRHDPHGHRAGHAQLSRRRPVGDAAGEFHRRRRGDPRPGERLRPLSAASCKPRAVEFRPARAGLRPTRPSGGARSPQADANGIRGLATPADDGRTAEGLRRGRAAPASAGRSVFREIRIRAGQPGVGRCAGRRSGRLRRVRGRRGAGGCVGCRAAATAGRIGGRRSTGACPGR